VQVDGAPGIDQALGEPDIGVLIRQAPDAEV
jgi:hypothetical protein